MTGMRAKFVNEIKVGTGKTGLGSIGVGRSALLFANDLKQLIPAFDNFKTVDVKRDNEFYRSVSKEVADLLFTDMSNLKSLSLSLEFELRRKLKNIMSSESTEEKDLVIPCEYQEEKKEHDEKNNVYTVSVVGSGKFFDTHVKIKYNVAHGVAVVHIDYNDITDVEKNIDDDSLRESLLYVVVS